MHREQRSRRQTGSFLPSSIGCRGNIRASSFRSSWAECSSCPTNCGSVALSLRFARMSGPVPPEDIDQEVLFDDPLVVVAGMENPWARRRKIKLAELVNEPWTWASPGTLDRFAHRRGLSCEWPQTSTRDDLRRRHQHADQTGCDRTLSRGRPRLHTEISRQACVDQNAAGRTPHDAAGRPGSSRSRTER